jgi:hypothetical protein
MVTRNERRNELSLALWKLDGVESYSKETEKKDVSDLTFGLWRGVHRSYRRPWPSSSRTRCPLVPRCVKPCRAASLRGLLQPSAVRRMSIVAICGLCVSVLLLRDYFWLRIGGTRFRRICAR